MLGAVGILQAKLKVILPGSRPVCVFGTKTRVLGVACVSSRIPFLSFFFLGVCVLGAAVTGSTGSAKRLLWLLGVAHAGSVAGSVADSGSSS